jgi:enoyl-CoA hydratase
MQNTKERIIASTENNITTLTINRESNLNALDWESLRQLKSAILNFEDDQSTRVLIITGAGEKAFSTGADLKDLKKMSIEEVVKWCMLGSHIFSSIADSTKPIIAAINGYALGGGLELALACDFRICTENSKFGCPEINFGWIPGWGGVKRLSQIVGYGAARRLLMLGEMIKATEAQRIGLVDDIVRPDQLTLASKKMAEKLSEKDPRSLIAIKTMLLDQMGRIDRCDSLLEATSVSLLSKSDYAIHKISAYETRSK